MVPLFKVPKFCELKMSDLKSIILDIVYYLHVGEVAYAYSLYPTFIDLFVEQADDKCLNQVSPIFQEMLQAQEKNDTVKLADLLEYVLMEYLE